MKLPAHKAELPGSEYLITGSAFLPAYKAEHPADLPVIEGNGLLRMYFSKTFPL